MDSAPTSDSDSDSDFQPRQPPRRESPRFDSSPSSPSSPSPSLARLHLHPAVGSQPDGAGPSSSSVPPSAPSQPPSAVRSDPALDRYSSAASASASRTPRSPPQSPHTAAPGSASAPPKPAAAESAGASTPPPPPPPPSGTTRQAEPAHPPAASGPPLPPPLHTNSSLGPAASVPTPPSAPATAAAAADASAAAAQHPENLKDRRHPPPSTVALTAMPLVQSAASRRLGHHLLLGQHSDSQHPEREYFEAVIQNDEERQAALRKGQVVQWSVNGRPTRALVEDIYVTKGNHQLSLLIWPIGGAQIITERNLQHLVDVDGATLAEDEARQAAEALERWTRAHQRPASAPLPPPSPPPPRQSQRAPKRALAHSQPAAPRPLKQPRHPSARVTGIVELPHSPAPSHPAPPPPVPTPPPAVTPPPLQLLPPAAPAPISAAPSPAAAAPPPALAPPASWPLPPLAAPAAPLPQALGPFASHAFAPTPALSLAPAVPAGGTATAMLLAYFQAQLAHQASNETAQVQLSVAQEESARLHHALNAERLAGLQQRLQQAASAQDFAALLSRLPPG